MKTWTNPTVEELDVALTAAALVAFSPEEWGNGHIDWNGGQIVIGGGSDNEGGSSNEGGNEGGSGSEEGGDIIIGQGS